VDAPFRSTTWDFSTIIQQAGHLEGLPLPGQGSNVVIGAHSELSLRKPGPFYHLPELKLGDDIIVTYGGQQYRYRVFSKWEVTPEKIRVLDSTSYEVLTLMTCSGYKNGQYATRLVVRAILVRDVTEVRQ
jgi:LPXTG-site transpeptidase (sortase) family protein